MGNPPNYISDDTIRVIIRSYKLNQPKGKIMKFKGYTNDLKIDLKLT